MSGFTDLIYFKNSPNLDKIILLIETKGRITQKDIEPEDLLIDFVVEDSNKNEYSFRIYSGTDADFDEASIDELKLKLGFIPKVYYGFMGWRNSKFEYEFVSTLMQEVLNISDGFIEQERNNNID